MNGHEILCELAMYEGDVDYFNLSRDARVNFLRFRSLNVVSTRKITQKYSRSHLCFFIFFRRFRFTLSARMSSQS
jgi:hypothetical protein